MTTPAATIPVGVVLRRTPGATRWARWNWRVAALLPGAGPADWRELRREGEAVEYHAATVDMELHRADAEAYMVSLNMAQPTAFVILRPEEDPDAPHEWRVHAVTASAYEAQDHQDGGDELVEPAPMPPALAEFVRAFCAAHHRETPFVKRRRDKARPAGAAQGVGDPRIRQPADVYRAPAQVKPRLTPGDESE
ncbi:DUF3305 domain-containing protein [Oceanicella actignis]|uniref:Molybdopterin-guanine dinucleotide biosynthesis protein A n=1 Tax=Oceanicella actignis TaxID=1189325 RepID=A0A1M7TUX9_9RHOB|nr:DUF3305 domain-containing protein [Oceanicella actignis]TYO90472.1 uncharacterized protein DUF3305 [Oceanicella actignis]SES79413.1 Protein of unknown function [Oceanicella actignis]SHN74535.1 Protein of unknown function [Oceanicella actignis]